MTRYFIPEYLPASQIPTVVTINQITWDFLPDNSHRGAGCEGQAEEDSGV
jgi:hypothetical protein